MELKGELNKIVEITFVGFMYMYRLALWSQHPLPAPPLKIVVLKARGNVET